MNKIFLEDKCIFLTNAKEHLVPEGKFLFIKYDSAETLKIAVDLFMKEKIIQILYVGCDDTDKVSRDFENIFTLIEAAGGLVVAKEGELLLIHRKGKWDLPKGKIEKGEAVETAAMREVEEECGVQGLAIEKDLQNTYHIYTAQNKTYLKKTYWFKMTADKMPLKPQLEEGITEARWMNKQEVSKAMQNTYLLIKEVLKDFIRN